MPHCAELLAKREQQEAERDKIAPREGRSGAKKERAEEGIGESA